MSAIQTYDKQHILKIISAYKIRPSCVCMMDDKYVYLDSNAAPYFFEQLSSQVIDTLKGWKAQYSDCDKYSRVVQALGQMSHALQWQNQNAEPAGLALGVFNYKQKNAGGHSINCAIVKTEGKDDFSLKFFEPQTAKEVILTPAEIQSAFLILL